MKKDWKISSFEKTTVCNTFILKLHVAELSTFCAVITLFIHEN